MPEVTYITAFDTSKLTTQDRQKLLDLLNGVHEKDSTFQIEESKNTIKIMSTQPSHKLAKAQAFRRGAWIKEHLPELNLYFRNFEVEEGNQPPSNYQKPKSLGVR